MFKLNLTPFPILGPFRPLGRLRPLSFYLNCINKEIDLMFFAILDGAAQGAIVGATCKTKVKEMVLVGVGTSLISEVFMQLVNMILNSEWGVRSISEDKRMKTFKASSFVIAMIEVIIFTIAARKLGVFGTRGTILYIAYGVLSAFNIVRLYTFDVVRSPASDDALITP